MIQVFSDKRVEKILDQFSKSERSRVDQTIKLFSERGFALDSRDLKKISNTIWELRPARVRLLFGIIEGQAVIVNVFVKKTQKTPLKEIETAERRLKSYI